MILTLEEVKEFLRLEKDYTEEDSILTLMVDNAEIYIENATGKLDTTNEKMINQVKLAALVLVVDFYENRELTGKASEKVRDNIQGMLSQLKYCYGGETL